MRYAQLFDGTRLSFPDDTPDEVINRVAREETLKRNAPPVQAPIAPSTERTTGEAVKDIGAALVSGTGKMLAFPGQAVALVPGLRGLGSAIASPGEALAEYGESLKSQGLKVREALRSQAISEAEKDGILSEFGTAIKETLKDPALISTFLTEQVPNFLPPMLIGRLAAKIGVSTVQGLTGEAAEQAVAQAQRRGVTAAVGTGAAMQSADISSEAYKQAYEAAIAQGKPPEQAESEANNAARIAAGGAFGISLATQKLPGARAIEQRLIGAPGGVSRVVGGLGEATAESLEEAGGALFQNIGIRTVDPNQSLTQGVGAAAGLGLLGGGFFGTLLSKKATPEPLPGQLPGETIEQSILRLVAERESLKAPPVPESIIPDVDVIKLAGSLDEKGNPIGYALLTQYEERLKQLPESPERDQALQVASSVKERLNIESIQRQQNAYQNIITYKDMKDLGLNESDPLYEALVGKNLGAPDDATKVIEALNRELEQDISSQRRELVGVMLEQVQGFLDQVPGSGFYAPRTDQRADGAGASVSDQLGAGTPGEPQTPSDASLDASTGLPGKRDEGEGAQPSSLGASKKSLRPALTNLKSDIEAQLKDWRSKVYKPNEQAVFLKGDGPSNREMLKIGQINESRRQSAIENLTQDLNAIRRIQDQIKTEAGLNEFLMRVDGVYQRANQIVEEGTTDFANPGDLFEYLLLNEDLKIFPPRRGAYSSNSVSKAIRAIVEQRKAAADQIRAAEEERRASAKVEGQTQQDVDEESADYLMMLFGAEPEDKKLSLADVQKIPESKFREIEQRAKKPSKPAQPKAEEPPSTDKLRIDQINKELETLMKRLLSKYGLKDVSVQIVKDMAAKGEFSGRLIKLADDTDNPLVDLRHEAIHALKELGFFTPAQWETLKNKAAQEWVQTYLKDAPYTDKVSRYEAYKQMFEAEGKNPQEVEEALIEEAIADAFSYFNKTRAPSGLMASINFRLKNLFKALKQFLTDSDLSAEDIFGRIEEGKLPSKAEAKAAEPPKASLRDTPKIDRQRSLNDKRISPRFPTAVKATEDVLAAIRLQPDLATFKRDPDAFRYNIGLMSKYPNFTDIKGTPNQRAEQIINRLKDNLLWLYNSWDTNLRDRSKLWYVGGNRIAHRWAQKYGIPPETAAAIIASLSPQKDWFQNVSLAERTLDAIVFNADFRWDAAMDRVFKERAWTKKFPVKQYRGKTLKEMYVPGDPKSLAKMAVWIRAWDEGHNPQTARVITPEGTFTNEIASGKTGAPIAMRAQSFAAMVKTLQIMQDSNLENFSNLIGKNHKVRSFYNNIIAPFAGDDVTIDTHAVAAALMRPLGSSDLEVYHNFGSAKPAKKDKEGNILVKAGKGTKNSAVTGLYGTYAIYAEAYRRAAQEVGVFPREMQSITWEAIRGLFRPEQKQARLKSQVDALWNKVAKGEINAEDARQQISKLVSGIEDPAWVKSPAGSNESRTDSSYATELPGDRVPGREPERLPGGARERVARVRSKVKYSLKNINVESDNFKKWSNNAPIIPAQDTRSYKGGPAVFQAFHGSTYGDITVFDTERGDREGFLGAGPYLSTSVDDVNANYAGIGPDLTNKISRAEEDFADGFTDSYAASEMLQDYFDDNDLDIEVTDDNFEQLSEDYRDKAITHAAIKSLKGKSDGVVVPAYVRLLKPFDMRKDKGTNFTYEQKYDEDGEPVGEPNGTSMELIDAIRSVASTYNADADRLISEIYDNPDGISAKEVFDLAQNEFSGLYDYNGDLVSSGQVVQEIVKEMGFDGIIQPANDYFGSARPAIFGIRPKGMQGVYPDTLHLMPFSSDQIKSSVGNIGTFGQRAPTEEEAKRLGMSAAEAAKAQKRGDIRLSLRSDPPAAKEAMALVRKARAYKPEEGEPAVAFPLLFHSGTGDPQDIATYIEPRFGSWVSEVLSGSAEEDVDVDNFVPLSYYSSAPTWVRMQTARKLNKTLAEVTDQDVKNSGQLAVVYNVDDQFGDPVNNVYQIGKDGYNGGYTDVLDVYGNQKKLYETDLEEEGDYRSEAKTLFGVEPGDIVSKELITPDMVLVGDALIDFLNQYESEFPAQDRKGSKFSLRSQTAWTDKRIDSLLSSYAYTQSDREGDAKAYAARITPRDFINATTDTEAEQVISEETRPLSTEELAKEDQPIYLEIRKEDDGDYQIVNHEGRHRMMALANAGYDRGVPVVLVNRPYGAVQNAEPVEEAYLRRQSFGTRAGRKGINVQLMVPISWKYRAELKDQFGGEADVRFSLRSPDTKAFKQWFGDSKVVDANGNPLVVYHGTNADIAVFDSTKQDPRDAGFWFANEPIYANQYAAGRRGGNVMPVYLSIKNPKIYYDRSVPLTPKLIQELKKQGYDGVIRDFSSGPEAWRYADNQKEYAAFESNQIKSAIGNIGTFDPANPDIRYSLRTPKQNIRSQIPQNILTRVDATIAFREDKTFARRMMDAISPRGFSWFREQAINRYEYLAKIDRKYVNRMGGVRLLADQSAEAAALFSDLGAGITASAFGVHDRVGGIPVYRNGVVKVSNENNTIKGPLAVFAPLGKYGDPEVYRLYEFWATVKRGARLNAQGKLTPFTPADMAHAQALERQFPEFVTIQREWIKYNDGLVKFMQDTGVITPQAAQEFKQHGDYFPMYKYFEGDEVTGPKVFSSIANVAPPKKYKGDDQPLGDFFENVVRNTQAAIQAGIKNIAAQRATQVAVAVNEVTPLKFKPKKLTPEVYRVLENGMERYYAANDMMMISALKSLNIPDLPLIGVFAGPANLLRNLITKTPDFMLANMLRDSLSAWVTSGKNITPITSTLINFSKAIAEKSPELNALRNAGILGGYDYAQGVEATAQTFAKDLRKISNSRTTMEKITSPVTSLWGALEKASSASDAATRMEVYKKTLAETGNEAEALFQALEIMNFNRKGRSPVIRALTAAVPFLNARIQGLDVLYRSGIRPLFAGDATAQERARAKTFFLRGATIMALSAMYWMMTHDDDEYKVQEQETRDNYWLLPSMGVKIPIPFEIGVIFKVIPERILEYSFGDDTGKDFVNAMSRQLLNTFSFNPIPQTVVPIVEAATNYSFFTTRPILGQGMEGIAPEFQATPTTSKTATAITDAYNSVIELMPDAVAKKLKASPVILEHLIQGYTGTMGMYAMQTMDYIISANSDVPNASKRFEQMPVIRRFAVDPQARGTVTAFYDMKNAVDSVTRTANYLERTMNFEDQAEFIRDNIKTLAVKDYVQSLEKTMKEFREQKVVIRSSTMSADAKRSYIDIIEKMELQLTANIRTLKKQME